MQSHTQTLCAIVVASTAIIATAAQADMRVTFDEGAPKDRFTIENTGACAIEAATITLDLTPSRGKLIFDVTGAGAGVEVFQPFEVVTGAPALAATPQVLDGQTQIKLDIKALQPAASIAFTIDIDDTIGQREITVSGSEIAGAMAVYSKDTTTHSGAFSDQAVADVVFESCQ